MICFRFDLSSTTKAKGQGANNIVLAVQFNFFLTKCLDEVFNILKQQ